MDQILINQGARINERKAGDIVIGPSLNELKNFPRTSKV